MSSSQPQSRIPQPPFLVQDDYSAADPARKRFVKKSRFGLPSLHYKKGRLSAVTENDSTSDKTDRMFYEDAALSGVFEPDEDVPISIHPQPQCPTSEENRYKWAVLYENQRGLTVFSIPYYSKLSLLPNDPSPFTLPNPSTKRPKAHISSLNDYPLPDGQWRWVSKTWMIDMRTDTGDVQYDGFEYNWIFRKKNWHAEVGLLSTGGFVRRRRWVRLMMRPAERPTPSKPNNDRHDRLTLPSQLFVCLSHLSVNTSSPSTDVVGSTNLDVGNVWQGSLEEDWVRCHIAMKRLDRDGQKLELWKKWLGFQLTDSKAIDKKGKERQNDSQCPSSAQVEKEDPASSVPPKEWVGAVVQKYASAILHLFVYPDSRAKLSKLLEISLPDVFQQLGLCASQPEFWSYSDGAQGEWCIPRWDND